MIDYQLNRVNQEISKNYSDILRLLEAKEKMFQERAVLCQNSGHIASYTLCVALAEAVRAEIKITLLKIKLYDIPSVF